MDDPPLGDGRQCIEQGQDDSLRSPALAELAITRGLDLLEQIAIRISKDHVDIGIVLKGGVELDDVGMLQLQVDADLTSNLRPVTGKVGQVGVTSLQP